MNIKQGKINYLYLSISICIFFLPTYYYLKSKIIRNRTITFSNNEIVKNWNNFKLEIKLEKIEEIKKSFIDFYDKKQKINGFRKIFFILIFPLYFILFHPLLVIVKFSYKTFKSLSNKSLFDTIVVFDKNEEMIAIFIATLEEKEELRKYFSQKGFDIDNLSIFYTNQYSPDEITDYINKKG